MTPTAVTPPTPLPVIPEDAWITYRGRRNHKVFATNGDVLTHCCRWLRRDAVVPAFPYRAEVSRAVNCRQCISRDGARA